MPSSKPTSRSRGRSASTVIDDDELVTLQVPRRWREKLRKIAALEELPINALTEEAIRRWVTHWEKGVGHVLPNRPISIDRGIENEQSGLPVPGTAEK